MQTLPANTEIHRSEIAAFVTDRIGRPFTMTDTITLGDVGMDSLDNVEMLMAFEDAYPDAKPVDDDAWNEETTIEQVIADLVEASTAA